MPDNNDWSAYAAKAKEVLSELSKMGTNVRRDSFNYLVDKGMPIDQAYAHARRASENYDAKAARSSLVYGLDPVVGGYQIAGALPDLISTPANAGEQQILDERMKQRHAELQQEQPQEVAQARASGGGVDEFPLERALREYRQGFGKGGSAPDAPAGPDLSQYQDNSTFGLYSHAAETAAALPQAKGTPDQFKAMLMKQGVKPAEIEHSGYNDAFAGRPSVTKDELAQHFRSAMPKINEETYGVEPRKIPYPQKYRDVEDQIRTKYKNKLDELHKINMSFDKSIEERRAAADEREKLIDQMYAEIDQALPDREHRLKMAKGQGFTNKTKFEDYTLPGGHNYRELLLHLDPETGENKEWPVVRGDGNVHGWYRDEARAREVADSIGGLLGDPRSQSYETGFKSQHWSPLNVLSHIRMSDREGPNGEKILHVEELQSDWAQKARKMRKNKVKELAKEQGIPFEEADKQVHPMYGFKGVEIPTGQWVVNHAHPSGENVPYGFSSKEEASDWHKRLLDMGFEAEEPKPQMQKSEVGVPHHPLVASTQAWTNLTLKRILDEAAKGDYNKIIFTPGTEQAKRYKLSNHFGEIHYQGQQLFAFDPKGKEIMRKTGVLPRDLPDYIGEELADKLLEKEQNKQGWRVLDNLDLKTGGEGMIGFYDNIVPKELANVIKAHDKSASVKPDTLVVGSKKIPTYSLEITPKLKESVLRGQKAFSAGGEVGDDDYARGGRAFGLHPVHKIPGVHIVTADAGEPIFTGEK